MRVGGLYSFFYVVLMAFSVVWVSHIHTDFTTASMLMLVSFSAIVIYSISNIKKLKETYASIGKFPVSWLLMSASFALTWWLMYVTSIYASPRAAVVVFYLVVGLLGSWSNKQHWGVIFCLVALGMSVFLLNELKPITIVSSLWCGIFGYLYMYFSESYAKKASLSASQVLAVRFLLLFFVSVLYQYFISKHELSIGLSVHDLFWLPKLGLLVGFNLLPNYCAQQGIMLIGTSRFSQIIAFTPTVTFLIQGLFNGVWSIEVLALCLFVSVFLSILFVRKG